MSLAGHSGELVPDDVSCNKTFVATEEQSNCSWHLKNDDGTKIEYLTGASNGTWNGSYLRVTDTTGTVYYFGASHLPGADGKASTIGPDAQSAWTVPVYSPKPGDPCYNSSTTTSSWCQSAWRWNLDAVVDLHGNLTTYRYNAEANYYSRGAGQPGSGNSSYTRAGVLAEIDYGQLLSDQLNANGNYQSAAKVVFTSGERCVTSTAACDPSQRTLANGANWPDVPLDQQCDASSCTNIGPSFWTSKWLNTIATQVRSNGAYRTVDSYQLTHLFVSAQNSSENTQIPWLASVQRTGQDNQNGQTAAPLPPVSFGWMLMPNRVDGNSPARPDYNRPRLTVVTTETGGTIGVVYQQSACSNANHVMPTSADSDTLSCYNVKWYPPNSTADTTPVDDWFLRYPVTTVTVDPKLAAGDKPQTTNYTYGPAAWHHNDATIVDAKSRTWDQFRGYASVTAVKGTGNDGPQGQSSTSFYQGMNGDLTSTGTRSATVSGPKSGAVSDDDWLSGRALESDTYSTAGGSVQAYTVNTSSGPVTTATHPRSGLPDLVARYAATTATTAGKALKADGTWQTTGTVTTTDPGHTNRVVSSLSSADGTPDVCAVPTYATSSNPMLTGLVAQTLTLSGAGACTATPTAASTVSGSRTLFDGQPYGAAGAKAEATSAQVLDRYDASGNPQYTTTATTSYDTYGRPVSVTDANATDGAHTGGATTTTVYSTANAGELPNSVAVTAPAPAGASDAASGRTTTSTLDLARALPLTVTDPNGRTITKSYDALGRVTSAWAPGRATSQTASATFAYAVNGTGAASTVTSKTLQIDGANYTTSIAILDGLGRTIQTQGSAGVSGYAGRLVTDNLYDSQGRVWWANATYYNADAAPGTTWFNPNLNQVPHETLTTFDGRGRPVTSEFRAYGVSQNTTTTAYPGVDRTDVTPPAGGTATSTVLDARGRTAQLWQYRTANATGSASNADVTRYTYNPSGQPNTRQDAAGNTWSYSYDQRNRQISAVDPDTGTTTQSYDADGRLATTTDARGQSIAFAYDLLGRKTGSFNGTSTTDTTKQLTGFTYDTVSGAKGQIATSTRYVGGASGSVYSKAFNSYDTAYHPTSVTESIPGSEVGLTSPYTFTDLRTYDPISGALNEDIRGAAGDVATEQIDYKYDLLGPLGGFGSTVTYDKINAYDAYGRNVRTTVNPWGTELVATNTWDEPTGRQVSQFVDAQPNPTGSVQQLNYAYNQAGKITAITTIPNNTPSATDRQCFTYDYLGRLSTAWTDTGSTTMAPQPSVGAIGNCTNTTPTSGAQTPNRTTVGGPSSYWQSYSYDLTGNRIQQVQHDTGGDSTKDQTTNQTFQPTGTVNNGNGNGGPHALTGSQNTVNGVTAAAGSNQYDAAGNTTKIVDPSGTRNMFGGWVLGSGQSITSNTTRLAMQADGNLVVVSLRNGAVTWSSGTYNHPGAWATMQTDGNFVIYDTNHNPLWASGTYPTPGAYLALQDDGNLVIYKSAQALNQNPIWSPNCWNTIDAANTTTLTWDTEGKLASQTRAGATTTYLYDADGNQLIRRNPGKTTVTLNGGQDELTYNPSNGARTGTRYYALPSGMTLVRTASTSSYQFADNHGTNTLSIDASSLAATRNPVDPFGNPRTTNTATSNWAGDKGFVGGTRDTTNYFTNLGAREYQASTGRFISPDPLLTTADPQQWNGYAYSNNNPVNLSDPDGRIAWDPDTGVAAGATHFQDAVTKAISKPGYQPPHVDTSDCKDQCTPHTPNSDYTYTYREDIGPVSKTGLPIDVMSKFRQAPGAIFPFPVTGCTSFWDGATCELHPGPKWVDGVGTVKVVLDTPASFTFIVMSDHYFDKAGSTIRFSLAADHNELYLTQHAEARSNSPFVHSGEMAGFIHTTWKDMAHNLRSNLGVKPSRPQVDWTSVSTWGDLIGGNWDQFQ
ncbi:RHS repeat-associated core domain-containing protein [Kitasatospora azatica]|uniref:RHS repeat-associated core domain-containing protein n=1 Tax=Kitasatospora azatica TaxID=58347 RepID=UPI0006919BDD|nr:RHS repeat-associated core domain-containing protein [Kitasatospora azatica]